LILLEGLIPWSNAAARRLAAEVCQELVGLVEDISLLL
jgi:hypothetical protein